jgi:excisionase family DNA binding protein
VPEIKPPCFLSQKEAAAYLTVSVSTLRRWHQADIAPRLFRQGGILRYRREDLDAFMRDRLTIEK